MSFATKINLIDEKFCQESNCYLTLSGNTRIHDLGTIEYLIDKSSTYTPRSMVDMGYVTGITSIINNKLNIIDGLYLSGVTNGLNLSGKKIKLGGDLIENTTIGGNFTLNFCNGAKINTYSGYQISGSTILRTSPNTLTSLFIGYGNNSVGTGLNNIGIGSNSLQNNTTGYNNIGIGSKSLNSSLTSHDNVAIGNNSLCNTTNSDSNIGIGSNVMSKLTTGSNNIGLGFNTMSNCIITGCYNTSLGSSSLNNLTSGCGNNSIGNNSLQSNTVGCSNNVLGSNNLINNISGNYNISIGDNNLIANTTGSNNIGIGYNAGVSNITGNSNVFIGNYSGNLQNKSNKLYISNSSSCTLISGDFINKCVELPILKLNIAPSNGSNTDGVLVWNSTDNLVKKIDASCVLSAGITGATNGLTKSNQKVKLGGSLTGNTIINTNVNKLTISGTYNGLTLNDKCPTDSTLPGFANLYYIAPSGGTSTVSTNNLSYGSNCMSVCNPNTPFQTKSIEINWIGDIKITDTTKCKGIVYASDYSSNFTKYSLVDKNYVTGQTSISGIQTANNGLTKIGTNVKLGGDLTGNTTINGATYSLNLGTNLSNLNNYNVYSSNANYCISNKYSLNATGNIDIFAIGTLNISGSLININSLANYNSDYSSTYTKRSLVDKAYVTGLTTSISGSYVNSANNGLTKYGNNVRLGGSLTGSTTINGGGYGLNLGATGSLIGGYNLCSTSILNCSTGNISENATNINLLGSTSLNLCSSSNCGVKITSACGAYYSADYSLGFGNESLVTKRYVTGLTTSISGSYVNSANNGLTKYGNNVRLGGTLTGSTTINGGGYGLNLGATGSLIGGYNLCSTSILNCSTGNISENATNINLLGSTSLNLCTSSNCGVKITSACGAYYSADYSLGFGNESLVTKRYVTGITSNLGIQTANNGLTKSGLNVKLGGSLIEDTTLNGTNKLIINTPLISNDVLYTTYDNTLSVAPTACGSIYYNNNKLKLIREFSNYITDIGEDLIIRVYNNTGSIINKGTVVYPTGTYLGMPTIGKAIANNSNIATSTIGVTSMDISDNSQGYVKILGIIDGLNTSTIVSGSKIYLSTTSGCFTNTQPSYPNETVYLGTVICQSSTIGSILLNSPEIRTPYTSISKFNTYTGNTLTCLNSLLLCSSFNTYTGNTLTCLNNITNITNVSLTGATNGLTKSGRNVLLGGTISNNTIVCGNACFKVGDVCGITLSTQSTTDIGLNAKSNGGIYLKSQSGVIDNITDTTSSIGIQIDYNASNGFNIFDNRVGSSRTGIVYAADYSNTYTSRSLVDKAYVDSVATGLESKSEVSLATTNNIVLSGSLTIDGVPVTNGMRVLVKNQTESWRNGIYSACTTGSWTRAYDYDFSIVGEVSNGDLVSVSSGISNANSIWIMSSPNPIISGTTSINFTRFLQQYGVTSGDGISVVNNGLNKQIFVSLSNNSGLQFCGTGLSLNWNSYRVGLCCSGGGYVDLRVSKCIASGNQIPVSINTGGTNTLYVDSSTVSTCMGTPIINVCNGLTKSGSSIKLGGNLVESTIINGNSYNLSMCNFNSYTLGYNGGGTIIDGTSNARGLEYYADYSNNYTKRSLVDKEYVNKFVTGDTLTCRLIYTNGITKTNNKIKLGGTLTGDTSIIYNANRLCFKHDGTSCMDLISDCSQIHIENTNICIRSCTNTTCNGSIVINGTNGNITLNSNSASNGINITSPNGGAVYNADYSSTYIKRSLVDKEYVTGITSSICSNFICSASNGLTKSGTNVKLGGTLSEITTINGGGFGLNIGSTSNCIGALVVCSASVTINPTSTLSLSPTGSLTLGGSSIISNNFITYNNNYSSNFTKYSLVDKNYVTGQTSISGIQTANNGLTKIGTNVKLGGDLTGNTSIKGNYSLGFCNNYINITGLTSVNIGGNIKLATSLPVGTTSDSILVLNTTDKTIKAITGGDVLSTAITGATNGLTKTSKIVKLGGTFSENTNLSGNFTLSFCNLAKINSTTGYQLSGNTYFKSSTLNVDSFYIGRTNANGSGANNIGLGLNVLNSITTGTDNIGIGTTSLYNNNTGSCNISIGKCSLYSNQTGTNNISIGCHSLASATSSSCNIAIGNRSLSGITTGCNNISIGQLSLQCSTSACNNIAIGDKAGRSYNTGINSIFIGNCAGYNETKSNVLHIANNSNNTLIYGNFTGNTVQVPSLILCTTPSNGSITDGVIVWNSGSNALRQISVSCVIGNTIQTANNGLTKYGNNVRLGGTLTGSTTISDGGYPICYNGSGSFNICTTSINNTAGTGGATYTNIAQSSTDINIIQCSTSLTQRSSINLSNSDVNINPNRSFIVNAVTKINEYVCAGATQYSCLDVVNNRISIISCGASGYGSLNACGDGTSVITSTNGIILNTSSSNGTNFCSYIKLSCTPSNGSVSDNVLVWNQTDKCVKIVAGSSLGDKNNIYNRTIITSSSGLTVNAPYIILVNHTTPITITLPQTPTNGLAFKIKDASSGGALLNNITISRNGNSIDRQTSDALINTDAGAIELVYDTTLGSWFTLAFIN